MEERAAHKMRVYIHRPVGFTEIRRKKTHERIQQVFWKVKDRCVIF
jgi:hypothetical protein